MSRVVTVKTGDIVLRCRKEPFGCLLYDSRYVYAEGNNTVYEFIIGLSEGKKPQEIANNIAIRHNASKNDVLQDLHKFLKVASLLGWFRDIFEAFLETREFSEQKLNE